MTAFDRANAALFADSNIAVDGFYRVGAVDPVIAVRVVISSPDETLDVLATQIIRSTDKLSIPFATIGAVNEGDSITVGSTVYLALYAKRDAQTSMWNIYCKR